MITMPSKLNTKTKLRKRTNEKSKIEMKRISKFKEKDTYVGKKSIDFAELNISIKIV